MKYAIIETLVIAREIATFAFLSACTSLIAVAIAILVA